VSQPSTVVVTPAALAAIYEHARRDYPKECCGIVFGAKGDPIADRARACRNIQDQLHAEDPAKHPRDAHKAYHFDTDDLFLLQKSLDGDAPAKIIYHSHCDVGAYFSETDQQVATFWDEPAFPVEYLVVDVQADGPHGAKQFAWHDERKLYVEVATYP
jgi:proteasome lid subunit RPN8/RPN11